MDRSLGQILDSLGQFLGGSVRDLFLFAEGEFEGFDEVFGEVGEGAKD